MSELVNVAVVALGSAVGGALRYGVARLLPHEPGEAFPWGTLLVNVTGSLAIGVIAALATPGLREPPILDARARLLLATGICGGYTTFSTFSLEAEALLSSGRGLAAAVYVLGSALAGVGAVTLGAALARRAA